MLRSHILPFCFSAALFLFPAQAMAQALTVVDLLDMPLEQLVEVEVLVTGSSKYAQKTSEAPSIVEIITAEDIRTYGYRTLGDALNGMHGLYTSNDRKYTTLGVRGFLFTSESDSRVLVMIDGRRMNENVYDSAYVGEEFMLDTSLIDRIEYIPGPGSSIYGANAMMGVINVVTKNGSDIDGTEIEVGHGSYKTSEGSITYGKTLSSGADVLLSASGYNSQGQTNLYFPEQDFGGGVGLGCDPCNGLARNMDEEHAERLFAKVRMDGFTFTSGYVDRFKRVPTSPFTTFIPALLNDPDHKAVDRQAYGEIKYNKAINDKTSVDLKGFYHWYDSVVLIPHVNFFGFSFGTDNSSYSGRWGGGEITVVTTAFDRQKIVIGAEFQHDFNQELFAYNDVFAPPPFSFGVWQDSDRSGIRSGFYAQDAISLRDNLVLNAGFRLDQHHMIDQFQFNPRLGLVWNPQPSTTVKLLYGSAFRAPNIFERDYNGVTGWEANPDNEEEHIKNYEAAVEWKDPDGIKLTGSLFYNEFTDVIDQDPTFATAKFLNTGNLRSTGFDLGAEKKWDNGREVKAFFNHTRYIEYSGTMWGEADSPENTAKILYTEPLFDGRARLGIENIFVGRRAATTASLGTPHIDAYDLVNATITSDNIIFGADVSVSVYNVFDTSQDMVGSVASALERIPMNGRSAMLRLKKKF